MLVLCGLCNTGDCICRVFAFRLLALYLYGAFLDFCFGVLMICVLSLVILVILMFSGHCMYLVFCWVLGDFLFAFVCAWLLLVVGVYDAFCLLWVYACSLG